MMPLCLPFYKPRQRSLFKRKVYPHDATLQKEKGNARLSPTDWASMASSSSSSSTHYSSGYSLSSPTSLASTTRLPTIPSFLADSWGCSVGRKTTRRGTSNSNQEKPRFICGFEILDTLGKGMTSKVKRGRCVRTGRLVALKIIDKGRLRHALRPRVQCEIQALLAMNTHINTVRLLHYEVNALYPRKHGGTRDVVCLAMEFADSGELSSALRQFGPLPEAVAKWYFFQLISALASCHAKGICHRDVKPNNLLLDKGYSQLKLGDFGLAAFPDDARPLLTARCGTKAFMAPEVLARRPYDGFKADCWSAGVVLFMTLCGETPFQLATAGDWWFDEVSKGNYDRFWRNHCHYHPNRFSEGVKDLLTLIFRPDPSARPTMTEILADPWMMDAVDQGGPCTDTPTKDPAPFLG